MVTEHLGSGSNPPIGSDPKRGATSARNYEGGKVEMSNQKRNHKRKFARGGSSSSKRIREFQVESLYSCKTREILISGKRAKS